MFLFIASIFVMQLSLKNLRIFLAAAECRSITGAASALNVSQPSVSIAVAELERSLGVQLFVRHHARGIAITAAGADVLREARKLLAQASDLETMASALGSDLKGHLRIGCLPYLVPRYLPSILAGFSKLYPEIELSFIEGDQALLVQSLMTGDIECALSYNIALPNNVDSEALHDLPPYVILSENHALAHRKRIKLGTLAHEPVILLDLPISRDYYNAIFSQKRLTPFIRYRTTSVEAVRSFVANGLGYSILNHRAETRLTYDGKRIVELEIIDRLPTAQIVSIRSAGTRVRRVAQAFTEYARSFFVALRKS